jgi:metal-responsive CopG/Arc/MetJ family transcriptional regulator
MKRTTTDWKFDTGQTSINFCVPYALLCELDGLKQTTGNNRSEMIRTAIRLYIKVKKEQLADQELKELENYHVRRVNNSRRINTGLLPDY